MAYGNMERMWTLEEYIKKYEQLQASELELKEIRNKQAECIVNQEEEIKQLQARLDRAELTARKYSTATEYYDNLIEGRFLEIPLLARKLANQAGSEILKALKEEENGHPNQSD